MNRAGLTLAGAAVLACCLSAGLATTVTRGRARIVDGDTLDLTGPAWQFHRHQRVRLAGIDAPEKRQACRDPYVGQYMCGLASTVSLRKLTEGREVTCAPQGRDRYARMIAHCSVADYYLGNGLGLVNRAGTKLDLGLYQVLRGHAMAYRRYSIEYVSAESFAKEQRLGIWAGTFEAPWDWRKHNS